MEKELSQFKDYINLLAKKYNKNDYEEDLKQEGYIALILAYNRFNPEKGLFENYAKKYIKFSMLTFLNRKTNIIKKANSIDLYFNQLFDLIEYDEMDDEMDDEKLYKITRINYSFKKLKQSYQTILTKKIIERKSFQKIAIETNSKKSVVYQKYKKAILKLK